MFVCLNSCVFRTLTAVYEVVGEHKSQDSLGAEELFRKLDENSDGEISQEEFINIIKQGRFFTLIKHCHKQYKRLTLAFEIFAGLSIIF